MELRNLISFNMIAETGSFSKAAQMLGYAQSTITFQIKQLEDELGIPLFNRIGNHVDLTQAGKLFLDYSIRIISMSEEAKNAVIGNIKPSGTLSLTGISSLSAGLLPKVIKKYSLLYPEVTINASTGTTEEVFKSTGNGAADIGIYMDWATPGKEFITAFSEPVRLLFVASPQNKLVDCKELSIKDLSGVPLIVTEETCCYRRFLMQVFEKEDVEPTIYFETDNTEIIKQFVQNDIGIAMLPAIAVTQEIKEGRLSQFAVNYEIPAAYINLIYNRNKWLSPAMSEFINVFKDTDYE